MKDELPIACARVSTDDRSLISQRADMAMSQGATAILEIMRVFVRAREGGGDGVK